jgi:hypothetical protein
METKNPLDSQSLKATPQDPLQSSTKAFVASKASKLSMVSNGAGLKKYRQAYVEITSACNFKCSFCPSPQLQRQRSFMDPELFGILAPQVAELCDQLYLHVMGEPTLHPKLLEIMEICAQESLPVALTTNGSLLERHGDFLLSQAHLRQVNLSLHALAASPLPRPAPVILEEILQFCARALEQRPDLYINLRLWNLMDLQSGQGDPWNDQVARALEQHLGLDLQELLVSDAGATRPGLLSTARIGGRKSWNCAGRLYLHFDSRFEWPSHSKDREKSTQGTCRALGTHFAVLVDGRVVPCCLDEEGALELGRVPDQTLLACLEGPRAQAMREGFGRGQLVEDLCQSCQFCKRFSKSKSSSH